MKFRVVLFCVLGGLGMSAVALGAGNFVWWYLAGMVMAAAFVPVAMFGPRRFAGQFGVVLPVLLIVAALCTWSEALLFLATPEMKQHAVRDLLGEFFTYTIISAMLAALASLLKLPHDSAYSVKLRAPTSIAMMVVVAGVAYAVFYLITGGITYQFFTRQYYPDAVKMVAPLGMWFWVIQVSRGVLMTLAVVPVICTLRMSRMNSAIAVGLLVWVTGGLALLIPPNPLLGPAQRFIHTIEILTQNFPLGFVATLLIRPKTAAVADVMRATTRS
jgi:hypothetical protein